MEAVRKKIFIAGATIAALSILLFFAVWKLGWFSARFGIPLISVCIGVALMIMVTHGRVFAIRVILPIAGISLLIALLDWGLGDHVAFPSVLPYSIGIGVIALFLAGLSWFLGDEETYNRLISREAATADAAARHLQHQKRAIYCKKCEQYLGTAESFSSPCPRCNSNRWTDVDPA